MNFFKMFPLTIPLLVGIAGGATAWILASAADSVVTLFTPNSDDVHNGAHHYFWYMSRSLNSCGNEIRSVNSNTFGSNRYASLKPIVDISPGARRRLLELNLVPVNNVAFDVAYTNSSGKLELSAKQRLILSLAGYKDET